MIINFSRGLFGLVGLLISTAIFSAEPYPSKTIKIISPFSAGGGNDLIARAVASKLGVYFKKSVIVENREGGGGNIGTYYVAKAAPDGYTLLMTAQSLTMRPALFDKLPFDVSNDFISLGIVGSFPVLFLTNAKADFDNISTLISYSKAHPDKLAYGSPGIGTTQHVAMELFKAETGAKLLHIPYKGASKAVVDTISGVIPVLVSTPSSVMPFVKSGQLRLLGTGEDKRLASLNNAPTIGETVPGYKVNNWIGLMAPANTPASIVEKLDRALVAICRDADFISELKAAGFEVKSKNANEMSDQVQSDIKKWTALITMKNIRP